MTAALTGCRSYATFDDLSTIHKGMSPTEVAKMVDLKVKDYFDFSVGGNDYHVETYPLQLSEHSSTSSYSTPSGFGGGSVMHTTTTTTITTAPFICLFHKEKLVFWGFLNEFSKSEDKSIADLAPVLYNQYYTIYKFD